MKQPNFKRKALGLLAVPLALGALPLSAEPLTVEQYFNGYSEFYYGTDAEGNTFVFYMPDYSECSLVGIETSNTTATLPESVKISMNDEFMDPDTGEVYPPNYVEVSVSRFRFSHEWDYIVNPLANAGELKDIILTDNITDFSYRETEHHSPVNIHFTSATAPSVYVEGRMLDAEGLTSHCPISVPKDALEAYKAAFNEYSHCSMVIAEGTDPKEAFDAEVAALNLLAIEYNPDCVPYASYSATDENGTLFAFEYPGMDITLRGAITTAESITVPEYVCTVEPEWYAYRTVPVNRCCLDYYNEDNNGFPGSSNLKDIYMPKGMYYAEFHGEGFNSRIKFHFTSENVPEFHLYDGSDNYVYIVVPDNMFYAYDEALGNSNYVLQSETPASPVTVNVSTPGTLAEQILSVMDDLASVRWLIVTGTPDELDLRAIRRLPRLEVLDLSATTGLNVIRGCNGLKYLHKVILPEDISEIGEMAFTECRRLNEINIPASVKRISSQAFQYTSLMSVDLQNVESIGNSAFEYCNKLQNVKFSDKLTQIESNAFYDCNLMDTLVLPESLRSLGWNAFTYNHNIKKIVINKNLTDVSEGSFQGVHPEIVECHMLFPHHENIFRYSDVSNTTLYVPALTLNEYLLHDKWFQFVNIEPLPEDLAVLDINREFTIKSDKGIADNAELNMVIDGHVTVNRNKDLNLGHLNMTAHWAGDYYDPFTGNWKYNTRSTIIPESTVTADNIDLNFHLSTNDWTFLSFPFDVNVKDIVVDEDALWVVRKYSGEARAKLEENTWQNMTDDTVLKAGEGYIFNCASENNSYVNFTIRPAKDGNALFANIPVEKKLASNPSEFAHNASWNLAGNTFPAYLNLKGVEFEAPVTVWEGGTYYAYSPIDDDLVLEPFQAFFVQAQDGIKNGDVIKLNPEARAHSREAAAELDFTPAAARAPQVSPLRSLFNIHLNGENGSDRTRVVINEEASVAYEANRDASKFMSTDELVPQIFVNNSNVRLAINETPLCNGEFILGARIGKKGQYTISLDTHNADSFTATLIDNVTGQTTDLMAADYTFDADASLNDSRFTLALSATNAVDAMAAEGLVINVDGNVLSIRGNSAVEISVASVDGKTVAAAVSADFSAQLESGIYIVKAAQKTLKVKVGK